VSFFRRKPRAIVTVPCGHLAYVRDTGEVIDLGQVTEEELRLLNALCEVTYRNRESRIISRSISKSTVIRLRGMVKHWYDMVKPTEKGK